MKLRLILLSCLLLLSSVFSLNDLNGVVLTTATGSSSVDTRPGARSLLSLPHQEDAAELVALLNGTIYLQNKLSGKILWSFSTGEPLYSSYQAPDPFKQDEDENYVSGAITDFIVDVGDDWQLYAHDRKSSPVLLPMNIEDFIKITPYISEDRIVILGSKETSIFKTDAKTGKLISSSNSHGSSKSGIGGGDAFFNDEKKDKDKVRSVSTATAVIYIKRTDYALKSFGESRDLNANGEFWNMTVAALEADFFCEASDDSVATLNPNVDVDLGFDTLLPCQHKKMIVRRLDKPRPSTEAILGDEKLPLPSSDIGHLPHLKNEDSKHFHGRMALGRSVDNADLPSELKGDRVSKSPPKNDIVPLIGSLAVDQHHVKVNSIYVIGTSFKSHPTLFFILFFVFSLLAVAIYHHNRVVNEEAALNGQSYRITVKSSATKRKKNRKSGKINCSSETKDVEMSLGNNNDDVQTEDNSKVLLDFNKLVADDANGRRIGKLLVLNREIAMGSNGTVVLEGVYDGRHVAVKRLVRAHHNLAFKEIQNLIASDRHPNIVRWYGVEYDEDFVYIALERCNCNLDDMIQMYSASSLKMGFINHQVTKIPINYKFGLDSIKSTMGDLSLWSANGRPSSELLKLMRDVVSGLAHLHQLGIIHRDLKPQNVLITKDRCLCAKLSDMGISKRLHGNMSALDYHATGCGSSGWQAPEQLLHGRQTRAVDLFSLGCVLFYCITGGNHPFGDQLERDINIVKLQADLFLLDYIPEAQDLISRLLNPNPTLRPTALEVLHHPMFWTSDMRLSFFRDASDRVELEDRESNSDLLKTLEGTSDKALGGKWNEKMEHDFLVNIGYYRRYRFDSVRDLLRVMRNKLNHYRELPNEIQQLLGAVPDGYDDYFTSRFPNLLIEVYNVVSRYCKEEDIFLKYFNSKIL